MGRQPTTRLQVSGYRFLLRRIEFALLRRDIRTVNEPGRPQTTSLMVGCLLAIIAVAGCAVLAVLRPRAALGDTPIAMGQESGALYVRVGDTWHPVLNLASARLIAATNVNPRPVREAELRHTKRGALLGLPGAPQFLGEPLEESVWSICDTDGGASTAVVVGPAEETGFRHLAPAQLVLTSPDSGSTTYLLHDGKRAVVDLDDPSVRHALRLEGQVPQTVSRSLLSLVPETSQFPVDRAATPLDDDSTLCVTWAPTRSGHAEISFLTGSGPPVPAGRAAVTLAQGDGNGPAVDAVYLPPGRSAYVRAVGLSGEGGAGTRYLVTDTGVRFAVHDDDAARDLGLPAAPLPAPWPVLAALPSGPELGRQNASVSWDAVAVEAR